MDFSLDFAQPSSFTIPRQHGIEFELNLPSQPFSPLLRFAHLRISRETSRQIRRRVLLDYELVLQVEGQAWIAVEALGGSLDVYPGQLVFIPPGLVHAYGELPGSHIAVHFDLHAQRELEPFQNIHTFGTFLKRQPQDQMPLFKLGAEASESPKLTLPLLTTLRQPQQWRKRLESLIQLYQTRTHFTFTGQLRFLEVLGWAINDLTKEELPGRAGSKDWGDRRIMALLEGLDVSKQGSGSVSELAQQVGMSESAFREAFFRTTGRNPHQFLEEERVALASRLLLETERTVGMVALTVGYDDPYHFSRVFKRVTGLSPRAYRHSQIQDKF